MTQGVDVESHYLNAAHLAELNGETESDMSDLLSRATTESRTTSIANYVNGRSDIAKKAGKFGTLNLGELAATAPDTIDGDVERYCHAKTVLKVARRLFQEQYGRNLRVIEVSPKVAVDTLAAVAARL